MRVAACAYRLFKLGKALDSSFFELFWLFFSKAVGMSTFQNLEDSSMTDVAGPGLGSILWIYPVDIRSQRVDSTC